MQSLTPLKFRTLARFYARVPRAHGLVCSNLGSISSKDRMLKDKVAIVTGGAEGIGFVIADTYLREGAKAIFLLDINDDLGSQAKKHLNCKYGDSKVIFYKCNVVTDLEHVASCIDCVHPFVDILVNNAGIMNEFDPKKLIDTNLAALIQWTLKYYEAMRKEKGGKGGTIVNLSSCYGLGFRINQYLPVYQASTSGIIGFTKALGHPYNYKRSGVRVYAICPGLTCTKMIKNIKVTEYDDVKRDFDTFLKYQKWQQGDAVGRCAVETFARAESGSAWLIEGNEPIIAA